MKTNLLAAATLVGLSLPAYAADLPRVTEPVAPAYQAPTAYNWSGFYVGGNIGYGFASDFAAGISSGKGIRGGLQAGYNFQYDPLVFGIEATGSYGAVYGDANDLKGEVTWMGTLTPRVGVAVDRFLPYVKGGFAVGSVEGTDFLSSTSQTKTLYGWTVGAGVEYAVTNQISVKAEYNYTDLGKETYALAPDQKIGYKGSEAIIGVNYRF